MFRLLRYLFRPSAKNIPGIPEIVPQSNGSPEVAAKYATADALSAYRAAYDTLRAALKPHPKFLFSKELHAAAWKAVRQAKSAYDVVKEYEEALQAELSKRAAKKAKQEALQVVRAAYRNYEAATAIYDSKKSGISVDIPLRKVA